MKTLLNILLITAAAILSNNCSPTEPPDDKPPVEPDSTTQNFTFETFEFGDGYESNELNDVWIFDENNIWAVGFLGALDTIINGTQIYNANITKWNGQSWEIQPFSGTTSGIYGIWALDPTHIYFANGIVVKYDGSEYRYEDFSNVPLVNFQAVHKLWGSSKDNIWGVGPNGTIVHYDGTAWSKIDFDQQWYFYDITGKKQSGAAYAVARNQFDDCIVVELQSLVPEVIYKKSTAEIKVTSWTITESDSCLYLVSSDLQSTKVCRLSINGNVEILNELSPYIGVKASFAYSKNDIYYFGDENSQARLIHYNGKRYRIFDFPQIDPDNYGGIHAIEDLAVSVGFSNNKAYVLKIKRSPK